MEDDFDLAATVYNSDSSGNVDTTTSVGSRVDGNIALTGFSADSSVYSFMGVPGDSGAGVALVDNYTPVPEPATVAALFGAVALGLTLVHRARRK